MRFLALEADAAAPVGNAPVETDDLLRAEAARTWSLYQAGVLREISFRADRRAAVLLLECADEPAARAVLDSLPLVQAGLIAFEVIGLLPLPCDPATPLPEVGGAPAAAAS